MPQSSGSKFWMRHKIRCDSCVLFLFSHWGMRKYWLVSTKTFILNLFMSFSICCERLPGSYDLRQNLMSSEGALTQRSAIKLSISAALFIVESFELRAQVRRLFFHPLLLATWRELGRPTELIIFCMSIIEFEMALLHAVYPGSCRSSGILDIYLSSALLTFSSGTFCISRRCFGRALKSLAPCTGKLAS